MANRPHLTGRNDQESLVLADRRRTLPAAMIACVTVLGTASLADAGVTLLSRQTSLRANGGAVGGVGGSGVAGQADFTSFDRFADTVGSDDPVNGIISSAQQYSVPGVASADGSGLEGAFGEGSVRSAVVGGSGISIATSDLDLVFRVTEHPIGYTIGGAMGITGAGTAAIQIIPMAIGSDTPIYTSTLDAEHPENTGVVDHSGLLTPGDYLLRVQAGASDSSSAAVEGTAYYNFTLMLAPVSQPPAAVPLPPAVLAGGLGMGLLAGVRAIRRLRSNREAA